MKNVKKGSILTLILAILPVLAMGSSYNIDLSHSEVGFRIRHLVSKTRGRFDKFSGNISFDAKKPKKMEITAKIDTASVNTNSEKRDDHLRNADFFDVEKYPEMAFTSTKVKTAGKNKYKVTGNLTLLAVTKPVTLDVEFLGEGADPWGNTRAGFSVTGKLDRKDYGMEYNITDKGGLVIGDKVEIFIEIEAIKEK